MAFTLDLTGSSINNILNVLDESNIVSTDVLSFNDVPLDGTADGFRIGTSVGVLFTARPLTNTASHWILSNGNGEVGSVKTNGTSTSYNTSSDPRLKSEFTEFDSAAAWEKFDAIIAASGCFSFLSNPDSMVWGFNAHKLIDAGLTDIASEGEGPRDAAIGDVYDSETMEAVTEERPVIDEETGQQATDEDGNPLTETVLVQDARTTKHRVTPAGIDQSKIVPYLVAVIADLRARLEALETAKAKTKAKK